MPNDPDRDGWLKSPLGSRTCQGRLGRFQGRSQLAYICTQRPRRRRNGCVARASGLKTLAFYSTVD